MHYLFAQINVDVTNLKGVIELSEGLAGAVLLILIIQIALKKVLAPTKARDVLFLAFAVLQFVLISAMVFNLIF